MNFGRLLFRRRTRRFMPKCVIKSTLRFIQRITPILHESPHLLHSLLFSLAIEIAFFFLFRRDRQGLYRSGRIFIEAKPGNKIQHRHLTGRIAPIQRIVSDVGVPVQPVAIAYGVGLEKPSQGRGIDLVVLLGDLRPKPDRLEAGGLIADGDAALYQQFLEHRGS
jgi:hypothetical protein